MTKLLYHENPYDKEFDATVKEVSSHLVILDRTLFYPKGGGQPSDIGYLINTQTNEKYQILSVKKSDDKILHKINSPGLKKGDIVKGFIDWDLRYKYMRMHTAQHLLSSIVLDEYDAATAGNQIGWPTTRIDFEYKFTQNDLEDITKKFNKLVDQSIGVRSYNIKRDEIKNQNIDPKRLRLFDRIPEQIQDIRIAEIIGIDKNPCGGIQVKNTKEIGHIKIEKTENVGKGKTRIVYSLFD